MSVNRVNIGSDNDLSSERQQTIIQTNAVLLSVGSLRTNLSVVSIKMKTINYKNAFEDTVCVRGRWINNGSACNRMVFYLNVQNKKCFLCTGFRFFCMINTLTAKPTDPSRCGNKLKIKIFEPGLWIHITSHESAPRWMLQNSIVDIQALVRLTSKGWQTTSH